MAKDLNQCNFIGRLGKEPEVKYTANGSAVVNISLACSDDYKDKNTGETVQQTNWVKVVIFGKLAEIAAQYLKKGSKVFFSGKFVTRKWQDQNGQDRYTSEIVANDMQMLDSKPDNGASNTGQAPQQQAPQHDDGFDDIPFIDPYKFTSLMV